MTEEGVRLLLPRAACGFAYMSKKGVPLYREGYAFTETLPQTTSAYEYAVLPR